MIKNSVKAAGTFALLVVFAAGAWGATVTQTTTADTFARQLFGTGSDSVVLWSPGSSVILTVGDVVDAGNAADFTVSLTGGTFGTIVTLSTFTYTGAGAVSTTIVSGGAAGDSSVTFNVVVTTDLAAADTFTLNMDTLTGASVLANDGSPGLAPAGSVSAVTTTSVTQSTGTNVFPNVISFGESPCVGSCLIAGSANGWSPFSGGFGQSREIDLVNRALLTTSAPACCDHDGSAATPNRQGVLIGAVSLNTAGVVLESGSSLGSVAFDTGTLNDGRGDLVVSVTGDFQGGMVFFDMNSDGIVGATEALNISGGLATATYTLDSQNTIVGAVPIYWIADGSTSLVPTSFAPVFSTSFTVPTNVTGEFVFGGAGISFSGIDVEAFAYAIPGVQSADLANVRIKNEQSSTAQVFLSCDDQAGASSFGEVGSIAGNATTVLNAAAIEAVIGGGWSGRLQCDVLSDNSLTVQVLTRTSGVLVNNTNVSGRCPVPDADCD